MKTLKNKTSTFKTSKNKTPINKLVTNKKISFNITSTVQHIKSWLNTH